MKKIPLSKIFLREFFFLIAGIFFFCAGEIFAQLPVSDTTAKTRLERVPDSTEMRMTDTLTPQPIGQILQQTKPGSEEPFRMKKSGTTAILYSLLLPGAGQIYVENYWKAPIFLGAAGISAYNIIKNNRNFLLKRDEFDRYDQQLKNLEPLISDKERAYTALRNAYEQFKRDNPGTTLPSVEQDLTNRAKEINTLGGEFSSANYSRELTRRQREVYRDNRDLSAFALLVVYLVGAVDAYVGAHLYDFTVEEHSSIFLLPSDDGGLKAGLRLQF